MVMVLVSRRRAEQSRAEHVVHAYAPCACLPVRTVGCLCVGTVLYLPGLAGALNCPCVAAAAHGRHTHGTSTADMGGAVSARHSCSAHAMPIQLCGCAVHRWLYVRGSMQPPPAYVSHVRTMSCASSTGVITTAGPALYLASRMDHTSSDLTYTRRHTRKRWPYWERESTAACAGPGWAATPSLLAICP